MSEQLIVTASLMNEKVKFKGVSRSNPEIILDYNPPIGDGEGYTSLELFLISLATCSGTSIAVLLRKMRKDVSGLRINIKGDRREQHPTYFEKIHLEFNLVSKDAEDADFEKAIKLSEESFCPVWNMVKNNVEISYEYNIERSGYIA
ncbi:OsmC family peroxiredoxin [Anaerocolumna sedimenticola]|uniref:OsmC family peroxiredoxin n=1 Tax=Anaerocolumna sedimenticola TaxID=2696063 RepID=A0A6P1TTV2_9FIRM|nr:OsmC family protein [Anaerocolumna sedimenticola]QHQ63391.1 OsmC family peroxiredoxin [Anaerocolumna sedimenticola]